MTILEAKHLQHCQSLASRDNLVLEVKINTPEQADFLLRLMYSDEMHNQKEMPELVSISYDAAVVSKDEADLLYQIKNTNA